MALVLLSDLKTFVGEETGDNDGLWRVALEGAHAAVAAYLQRPLEEGTASEERLIGNGSSSAFPKRKPISAVTSCTVNGEAVQVTFTPMSIRRKDGGRFAPSDDIRLTYTGGALDPERIAAVKAAVMLTAQAIYGAPNMDQNLQGESLQGVFTSNYHAFGPGAVPPGARTLLDPHKRVHLG